MSFREKPPTYEVVQWTGGNAQAIRDLWAWAQAPQEFVSKKEPNGDLRVGLDEDYYFATVPPNSYVVAGPCWGNTQARALEIVPAEKFAERFEEIQ